MLDQFLIIFLGLISIVVLLGSIVSAMVYEKLNVYLGGVLLIAVMAVLIVVIEHQARTTVQIIQGVTKC